MRDEDRTSRALAQRRLHVPNELRALVLSSIRQKNYLILIDLLDKFGLNDQMSGAQNQGVPNIGDNAVKSAPW